MSAVSCCCCHLGPFGKHYRLSVQGKTAYSNTFRFLTVEVLKLIHSDLQHKDSNKELSAV